MFNQTEETLEVWQRGPLPNIPALLQPVAHALLQAEEELESIMFDFPEQLLWIKPAGMASPAFHLKHLSGVLDRVFTYARAEPLSSSQFYDLHAEDDPPSAEITVEKLLERFTLQIDKAIDQLQITNVHTLTDYRGIGRKQLPSTVIGLFVHAAEHTMRHIGQLMVTVKILKEL